MNRGDSQLARFVRELRRRRTFRTAGLYVVGAWLLMQAADVFFPGWGLPDAAINILLFAAVLGFPLALVFGWFYDVTLHGIVRTPSADEEANGTPLSLQRSDYLIIGALVLLAGVIIYDATRDILVTPREALPGGSEADFVPAENRPENSIAVLPFANISDDPANEFFCDGISEEILNNLGGFEGLFVMARTSSFAFKGSDFGIRKISGLLGVRFLLQGSVRKYGNQLRISAQLVDETGAQRWTETFDRTLDNVFEIQSEIAELVSATILHKITSGPSPTFEPGTAAYGHYLVGRELLRQRTVDDALPELQKAIELEPGYAEAHAELAIAYLIGFPGDAALQAATAAIETALTLQPGLPRALAARGLYLQQRRDPDWAGSEQVLRRVLEEAPNMVDALNWIGNPLRAQGKEAEADAFRARAYQIDPLNPTIVVNMTRNLFERGEVDQAEQMLLRLTELPRPSGRVFMGLRFLYLQSGQFVKMNHFAKREALTGYRVYYSLQLNYALLARWNRAEEWVRLTNRDFPDHWYAGLNRANVSLWSGRYAEAARILEREWAETGSGDDYRNDYHRSQLGCTQSLSGDFGTAIETLSPWISTGSGNLEFDDFELVPEQCLAWALLESGERDRARPILDYVEANLHSDIDGKAKAWSGPLYLYSLNAALMGDHDLAIERLQRAIDAGWRGYYVHINDPRWAPLSGDPRFRELMNGVKADVDRQAEEVDRIDKEEDFPALLDAVMAERRVSRE